MYGFLWLTLRMMKKQKLRTAVLFFSLMAVCVLLHVFCGLGYYFWMQVHGGGVSENGGFDFRQNVLVVLAAVLLLVIFSCSTVLLWNFFSLTFRQKWKGLKRLMALGAARGNILFMAAVEAAVLFGTAVPCGQWMAFLITAGAGIRMETPYWIWGCIDFWLLGITCWCSVLPILRAVKNTAGIYGGYADVWAGYESRRIWKQSIKNGCRRKLKNQNRMNRNRKWCFAVFMSGKYHQADRKRHIRMSFAVAACMVLYVPASYLVNTNIRMNQEGLKEKYGITYSCSPMDEKTLATAMEEYARLKSQARGESVFYIQLPGLVTAAPRLLDGALARELENSGWQGGDTFDAACDIYFLEDACYDAYYDAYIHKVTKEGGFQEDGYGENGNGKQTCVFVNRYVNRTAYAKDAQPGRQETPLLRKDAKEGVCQDMPRGLDLKIAGRQGAKPLDLLPVLDSFAVTRQLPDGIETENAAVVFPLCQMRDIFEVVFGKQRLDCPLLSVCGRFAEPDDACFDRLSKAAGTGALGKLRNDREAYQEWYDSLHEIHMAMRCICGVLFFTAGFQILATLLLHCMQRRQGLAILWSLGQTKRELMEILALECARCFAGALIIGLPASVAVCYAVYRVYRRAWRIGFALPPEPFVLITVMTVIAAAAVLFVSRAGTLKIKDSRAGYF